MGYGHIMGTVPETLYSEVRKRSTETYNFSSLPPVVAIVWGEQDENVLFSMQLPLVSFSFYYITYLNIDYFYQYGQMCTHVMVGWEELKCIQLFNLDGMGGM